MLFLQKGMLMFLVMVFTKDKFRLNFGEVKSTGSEARWPRIESQICHIPAG